MSKIDVEKMTISNWIILVGENGISLLEKGRAAKFDLIAARKWGVIHTSVLIENLVSYIPEDEKFDLVLDDQMTKISYVAPAVAHYGTFVTENATTVTIHFYDILKARDCILISEKSDLNDMVKAFSSSLNKVRRIVLRGPTNDFRYVVYVETSAIVQKPNSWISAIASDLSTVLLNLPTAGLNSQSTDTLKSDESAEAERYSSAAQQKEPPTPIYIDAVKPLVPETAAKKAPQPLRIQVPTGIIPEAAEPQKPIIVSKQGVQMDQPSPTFVQDQPIIPENHPTTPKIDISSRSPVADQTTQSRDKTRKLTLIFSASDAPSIALLAAGVVWSLSQGQTVPTSITEIGAYRKKLSSPFRRLVGVSTHQETDTLPIPSDRLHRLIEDIGSSTQQPGDHILFFGYETLSHDVLVHISRFLQETSATYQIIVCHENIAQTDDLAEFESVFDGLARKSWVYLENTDKHTPCFDLSMWKTYKTPSLDDAILKKIMLGEFRVFEELDSGKTNLSILQSIAFHNWVAEFGASIADA